MPAAVVSFQTTFAFRLNEIVLPLHGVVDGQAFDSGVASARYAKVLHLKGSGCLMEKVDL